MSKRSSISFVLCGMMIAGSARAGDVFINEIMYHAASGFDVHDFIELHNTGGSSVDLTNWCVDGIAFCFPVSATIAPNAYLLLAKDAAGFQFAYGFAPDFVYLGTLQNGGELLQLLDASLVVMDAVAYVDDGLWPTIADGGGPSLELIDPLEDHNTPRNWAASVNGLQHTAGAANSVASTGLPPWITEVQHTQNVAVSTPIVVTARVQDATQVIMKYITGFGSQIPATMFDDGAHNDGAAADGMYGASIPGQIANTLVRFQITATGPTGMMRHPRTDDTINYDGTVVQDPSLTSNVPIIQWYIEPNDFLQALDHKFTDDTEPALVFYDGVLYDNVQIRVRGQSSRSWAKPNWKFIFAQGHDFNAPDLLPAPIDVINMQSMFSDKAYVREVLSHETVKAAGMPALEAFHVRLQQNGTFFGLFTFLEDPDGRWIDRQGLDPDGARYKAFDDFRNRGSAGALESRYQKKSRQDEDYTDLFDVTVGINDLVGQARTDFIFDNIDIPGAINYLATYVILHSNDHPAKNYYVYRDTLGTQRWNMHAWDLDLTFGRNFGAGGGVLSDGIWADVDVVAGRTDVSPSHPLFADSTHLKYDFLWNKWIDALHDTPAVREMFFRRLRTLADDLLMPSKYETRIDELITLIATEAAADAAKWGQYGTAQTMTEATDLLKTDYLAVRRTHLLTTHRVAGEIPETQSLNPPVIINELMYRPILDPTLEFVELYNPSLTESVDLSGWRLDGVALTFPSGTVILPDDYLLVVSDDVQFRANVGSGHFIPAQYKGAVSNGGELLTLLDAAGTVVDTVFYDDVAPWPTSPDGLGPSLELIDPTHDNNRAANWAASAAAGGTPGALNSQAGSIEALPSVFVNEAVSVNASVNRDELGEFDPWLELYNASDSTIDLGGLYLTDDYAVPLKWRIPDGTELCGRRWLIIWADGETGDGPLHTSFALSSSGGAIGLSTPSGTLIDYLNYPAMTADLSFGKFTDGQPETRLFPAATPAAANLLTASGVILNEYNAVLPSKTLKNGGSDIVFGSILGNGGDWFELVVTTNHLDMRGWQLVVSNDTGGITESIVTLTLTSDPVWSDLRSGTIITVAEDQPADVGYNPAGGDWWIQVQANSSTSGTYISALDFEVSNKRWQLTIKDDSGDTIYGPVGEGINPPSGIGDREVFKLEADPDTFVTPLSDYNDGTSSTFGAPNVFGAGAFVQDFDALRSQVTTCGNNADCDDADRCTADVCVSGECQNTAINPCFELSLNGDLEDDGVSNICPSGSFFVTLDAAGLTEPISRVLALVHYDTTLMTLVSVSPGDGVGSPWDSALEVTFDDFSGDVTYEVIMPGTDTMVDATVATFEFSLLGAEGGTIVSFQPGCPPFTNKMTLANDSSKLVPATRDSSSIVLTACVGSECASGSCTNGVCDTTAQVAGTACGDPTVAECSGADFCDAMGVCDPNDVGDGIACSDDGVECTDDVCSSGACTHPNEPASTPCGSAIDTDCDDPDTCDGSGTCVQNLVANDTPCTDDGVDCTDDVCAGGLCVHPNEPVDTPCGDATSTDCDLFDSCDGAGICRANFVADSTPCTDDGNECSDDVCNSGICTHPDTTGGAPCGSGLDSDCDHPDTCDGVGGCDPNYESAGISCGDTTNDDCTDPDTCNAVGSCLDNHATNGAPCADGEFCTESTTCAAGVCGGGSSIDCGDGLVCTSDGCDDDLDACVNTIDAAACVIVGVCYTDGELNSANECQECNTALNQLAWSSVTAGAACGDTTNGLCTDPDTCDGAGACQANNEIDGTSCDAGEFCTVGTTCQSGVCVDGGPRDCGDGMSCTTDSCDETGDQCVNVIDVGTCLIATVCFVDNDPNSSNECEECNSSTSNVSWTPVVAGTFCGDPADTDCSNPDTCDGAGFCAANDELDLTGCTDDANECTDDVCSAGTCTHPAVAPGTSCADDGNECTSDTCDGAACSHEALAQGTPCGDPTITECDLADTCNAGGLCQLNLVADNLSCGDDGNECTDDVCSGGACVHPDLPIGSPCTDDGVECTDDSCDTGVCVHPAMEAGTSCGSASATECDLADSCDAVGSCLPNYVNSGTACGDTSLTDCTNPDTCDGAGACEVNHIANGQLCDDGLFCTENEFCTVGVCGDGTAMDCSDGLSCTTDSCNEGIQLCEHVSTADISVSVDLEAVSRPVKREVIFTITDCDTGDVEERAVILNFNGNGVGSTTLSGVNEGADWISAVEGHTLGRTLGISFVGCTATVDFLDTDQLVAGDFQASVIVQDGLVDIVDFSILAAQWNVSIDPELPFGADASADGVQGTVDFTAIQVNFFMLSDAVDACPTSERFMDQAEPLAKIHVSLLPYEQAQAGDVDRNGYVDAKDIDMFVKRHGLILTPAFRDQLDALKVELTEDNAGIGFMPRKSRPSRR